LIKIRKNIDIILELGKVKITSFVAISTSVGYVLFSGKLTWQMFLVVIGVFLLACGSSALNHYQERNSDALMKRTKGRPIPSGKVSPSYAMKEFILLSATGSLIIYLSSNVTALILGFIAIIWYNGIYTPLKKKYALAVVPGSVIGAIPPAIGWVASGGNLFDIRIISLALFFFIWQIPHFWLLLLIYGKDYENAGFPTLTKIFSDYQLGRITFVWIASLVTSCLMIPFVNISLSIYSIGLILIIGIWLLWNTRGILSGYIEKILFRKAFILVNLFVLAVVIIISLDKLFIKEL
jgi:protoheme IX farnesyltransferase